MNVILALSTVSLALQVAACLIALAIAQAPGWRRARIVAALAGTAGLYSFFNVLGNAFTDTALGIAIFSSANLTVAAAHVGIWLWFSFSDAEGRWRSVPRTLRWVAAGQLAWTFVLAVTGNAVDPTRTGRVFVPWLSASFNQPNLTPLATLSAVITLAILGLSFVEQLRQARRGVQGAVGNALGFIFFGACAVEEVLVAMGMLNFIYLAEVGYLGLIAPIVAQFVRRFLDDAERLQALTQRLETEVTLATGERDAAREQLAAQARFAALGRMAGGVGHEINNPLQVLTLALEELHERARGSGDAETTEAIEASLAAAERIGRIVAGMRAYARPSSSVPERVAPHDLVRRAIEGRPDELGSAVLLSDLRPCPDVVCDRDRIVQALQHAISNSGIALGRSGAADGRVTVSTHARDGHAVIEVRDNGPGFPVELLPRLGEPFVTSFPARGSAGLGLFIVRGVVDAHGGMLELENHAEGGAVVRLLLPAVPPAKRA